MTSGLTYRQARCQEGGSYDHSHDGHTGHTSDAKSVGSHCRDSGHNAYRNRMVSSHLYGTKVCDTQAADVCQKTCTGNANTSAVRRHAWRRRPVNGREDLSSFRDEYISCVLRDFCCQGIFCTGLPQHFRGCREENFSAHRWRWRTEEIERVMISI